MTKRQRFLETMTFGNPDRPSRGDYFAYDSTRERWEREGLPKGADLNEYFDMDFSLGWSIWAARHPIPDFEWKKIEETDKYEVWQNGKAITKALKNHPPPAMSQFLSYQLQSREDWDDYKWRLDPTAPERIPEYFVEQAAKLRERDTPWGFWIGSSYGYMRDWWGAEGLSYVLYDDPAMVEEMMEYLTNLSLVMLERVLSYGVEPDWVMFWEDLAYNAGPLISPAQFKQFCLPYYMKVMEKVRAAGIKVAMVDSDGDCSLIIPMWLEAGVHVMHPMECTGKLNVITARKEYGKRIAFYGGIDKRALSGTRERIKAEVLPKLEACLADGGFIPAVDHGIPPDISWDNYRYFRELINETVERYY